MSVAVIKEVISGLSYDKLNVFHWHITGKIEQKGITFSFFFPPKKRGMKKKKMN